MLAPCLARFQESKSSVGPKLKPAFAISISNVTVSQRPRSLSTQSPKLGTAGSQEYRLIRRMHETSRYIDDVRTHMFDGLTQSVGTRQVDETDPASKLWHNTPHASTLMGSNTRR